MEYIFEGRWMKYEYEALVKRYFYMRTEVLRENLPSATMSAANTTTSDRRSNPSLQGERPAIKGLSRDIPLKLARNCRRGTEEISLDRFVFHWRASRDSSRSSTVFNSSSEIAAANFASAKWCNVAKMAHNGAQWWAFTWMWRSFQVPQQLIYEGVLISPESDLLTESIVSLEREVCSHAQLQVFSCYRGWKKAWQTTRKFGRCSLFPPWSGSGLISTPVSP
jgi:hypothetical protein